QIEPEVLKDSMASSRTLDIVRALLADVVEEGTAKNIKSEMFGMAGKTGTAVTNYFKEGSEHKNYQSSFAGYFPADQPKYSCIVTVYNPQQSGFYGGEVAAPVFRRIADRCMRSEFAKTAAVNLEPKEVLSDDRLPVGNKGFAADFKNVFRHIGLPMDQPSPSSWIATSAGEKGIEGGAWNFEPDVMPDLTGLGLRDAMFIMDAYGVKLLPVGQGKVVGQGITPGTAIRNRSVELYLE
ncbi:MAG TPA: penicillin-binding transpeptidase domain-containing protein, partial [Saprospiraceae bacterium]|nr:penicillin-binding transpeptidase domain-containing protein [Saprospiraceae bacterium]